MDGCLLPQRCQMTDVASENVPESEENTGRNDSSNNHVILRSFSSNFLHKIVDSRDIAHYLSNTGLNSPQR